MSSWKTRKHGKGGQKGLKFQNVPQGNSTFKLKTKKGARQKKKMNVKFYNVDGRYNFGVEGSTVEYLTDKKVYGVIATAYPMLADEAQVQILGRKFWIVDQDNSVRISDDETSREWTIPLKLTRQGYVTKRGKWLLDDVKDEERKKKLTKGWQTYMKLTSRNLIKMVIKDILVPLKRKGQFKLEDEYTEKTWLEPNLKVGTGIKHETTASYRFK